MTRQPIPADDPVIHMTGVTRRFNGLTAIDDVSLQVPSGSILGLIGPSGSGKTTAIRMLTGTLDPSEGEVRVGGQIPRRFRRSMRERIAYMPQLFSLYRDLTAQENVGFVAALYGISWFGRTDRIRRALETVDLWDARDRRAGDLSGGMQRRLELACALVHDPQILFIDEPTAGIDPMLRQAIWAELRRLRDEGRTLLVTTQYVGEAEYCDSVALLDEGHLVANNTPEAMRAQVFGGEMLDLEAEGPVDPELLANMPEVQSARPLGPRRLRITVEDAGIAAPRLLDAIRSAGVQVVSLEEYQPGFDDVFAELVKRRRAARAAAEAHAHEEPTRAA